MACPGSRQAEAAAASAPPSVFADAGTAAHVLFAKGLQHRLPAKALTSDSAVLRPLDLALDATRRILAGRAFMVEQRLASLPGLPEVWGTSDVVGLSPEGP